MIPLLTSRRRAYLPLAISSTIVLLMCVATPARADECVLLSTFGSYGSANGQLDAAEAMVLDNGNLYISDLANNRIDVFTTTGTFLQSVSIPGVGSMWSDFAGDIYTTSYTVVESPGGATVQSSIEEYTPELNLLSSFGTPSSLGPIAVGPNGDVYGINAFSSGESIYVYSSTGAFISSFGDFPEISANGIAVDASGNGRYLSCSGRLKRRFPLILNRIGGTKP